MERFDTDGMEDLMYDAAEGPAHHYDEYDEADEMEAYDEADEGDEYDEGDEFDEGDEGDEGDEFLGRIVGGAAQALGGLLGADEYDEADEFESVDGFDEGDSFEDEVADALEAEDADEFFGRLRSIARRIGRTVGKVARVVGPIASAIPLPQAQLIGRVANVAGRLLADGADEFEAIDELVDGMDDESIDAAAPLVAGLMLRRAMPTVARLARPARRQLVRAVTQATRTAVRRHGAHGARAVARIVRTTRARRVPARAIPRVVRRATQRVIRNPRAARRLGRPLTRRSRHHHHRTGRHGGRPGRLGRPSYRGVRPVGGGYRPGTAAARHGGCAYCGRSITFRRPVRITFNSI